MKNWQVVELYIHSRAYYVLKYQLLVGTSGSKSAQLNASSNAVFRANLWIRVERLMDHIQTSHTQVALLTTVLAKRRDPVTHMTFMEQLDAQLFPQPSSIFWEETAKIISTEFRASSSASSQLSQALETEYPRLLGLFKDLLSRLELAQSSSEYSPEVTVRVSLASFETAFLSRSFSRVSDPVNLAVSSRNPPTSVDVDNVAKTFRSELQVCCELTPYTIYTDTILIVYAIKGLLSCSYIPLCVDCVWRCEAAEGCGTEHLQVFEAVLCSL